MNNKFLTMLSLYDKIYVVESLVADYKGQSAEATCVHEHVAKWNANVRFTVIAD